MIEEQARVEIVREVHEKAIRALADLVILARLAHLLVLRETLLLSATPQMNAIAREREHLRNDGKRFTPPSLHGFDFDRARRLVFLNVRPALVRAIAVDIDGERILRHVCIVETETLHLLTSRPIERCLEILAQTIREHLRART